MKWMGNCGNIYASPGAKNDVTGPCGVLKYQATKHEMCSRIISLDNRGNFPRINKTNVLERF